MKLKIPRIFAFSSDYRKLENEKARLEQISEGERASIRTFIQMNDRLSIENTSLKTEQEILRRKLVESSIAKAELTAYTQAVSDNAKATEAAGRDIARALSALAVATERGARAKQREVEIAVDTKYGTNQAALLPKSE